MAVEKPLYMLEHPRIRQYSFMSHPIGTVWDMSSDNLTGADNQQETVRPSSVLNPNWIVGFVDGEGCFCVSVHRNMMMHRHGGWQFQPAFHVYQHQDHREILEMVATHFGCGALRPKGPNSKVLSYAVEGLGDLSETVVPFFERYRPVVKRRDFVAYAEIVKAMRRKEHLTGIGFERRVRLAFGMNANGKQRARKLEEILMGSSETARGAPTV